MKFIPLILILFFVDVDAKNNISDELTKALVGIQSDEPELIKTSLTYILQHQKEIPSTHLIFASAQALQLNKLEVAGYLYYAGQLRAKFDLRRFPSIQKSGHSPHITLINVLREVGSLVNPEVFNNPKVFSQIVVNLAKFPITTNAGYDPGWDYTHEQPIDRQQQILQEISNTDIKQLAGFSQLLNNQEYFKAFRSLQELNMLSEENKLLEIYIARKQKTENKMFEIEKSKNIVGQFYKGKDT